MYKKRTWYYEPLGFHYLGMSLLYLPKEQALFHRALHDAQPWSYSNQDWTNTGFRGGQLCFHAGFHLQSATLLPNTTKTYTLDLKENVLLLLLVVIHVLFIHLLINVIYGISYYIVHSTIYWWNFITQTLRFIGPGLLCCSPAKHVVIPNRESFWNGTVLITLILCRTLKLSKTMPSLCIISRSSVFCCSILMARCMRHKQHGKCTSPSWHL